LYASSVIQRRKGWQANFFIAKELLVTVLARFSDKARFLCAEKG
jgi:hypothetical protein